MWEFPIFYFYTPFLSYRCLQRFVCTAIYHYQTIRTVATMHCGVRNVRVQVGPTDEYLTDNSRSIFTRPGSAGVCSTRALLRRFAHSTYRGKNPHTLPHLARFDFIFQEISHFLPTSGSLRTLHVQVPQGRPTPSQISAALDGFCSGLRPRGRGVGRCRGWWTPKWAQTTMSGLTQTQRIKDCRNHLL